MDKLGRNYSLYVQEKSFPIDLIGNAFSYQPLTINSEGFILVEPPLTIEFDIQRNTFGSANSAHFRIYNLSAANRNKIFKPQMDTAQLKQIQLQAGYGGNKPIIFNGTISEAWSVREGNNFITNIHCYDVGEAFSNGFTNSNFPSGTSTETILSSLVKSLPGVEVGVIGSYPDESVRGVSLSGNTTELLRDLSGDGFFIDNGKGNCLGDAECLRGSILVINSESGLLGTPLLEGGVFVIVEMLFEPRIIVGQRIHLDSSTLQNYNSDYKVVGIHHRGMISESVCGDAITTLKLFNGTKVLSVVGQ